MSDELKPCPFCGSAVGPLDGMRCVLCIECGAESGWQIDAQSAIAAWNRRATPEALAASPEVQALIAAAETRGWNAAIEAAIEACVTEYLEDPNPGSEGDVAYQHAVADCFTAIRALKKGE